MKKQKKECKICQGTDFNLKFTFDMCKWCLDKTCSKCQFYYKQNYTDKYCRECNEEYR